MTFDEWIASIFDHPVTEPGRGWNGESTFWEGPDATIVEYMTRLFAEADAVLNPFSDAQAAQGLWAMVSQDVSPYPLLLTERAVPIRARVDCIEAMDSLFGRFFARRCSPHLSHLDTAAGTPANACPLNGVCYIWWDVIPLGGLCHEDWAAIQRAMRLVIRHCLESDSVACQESAILGLMSWSASFDRVPETAEVEAVEERVLSRESGVWPALRVLRDCIKSR